MGNRISDAIHRPVNALHKNHDAIHASEDGVQKVAGRRRIHLWMASKSVLDGILKRNDSIAKISHLKTKEKQDTQTHSLYIHVYNIRTDKINAKQITNLPQCNTPL